MYYLLSTQEGTGVDLLPETDLGWTTMTGMRGEKFGLRCYSLMC